MKKSLLALSAAMLILSVSSCKKEAKTEQEGNAPETEQIIEEPEVIVEETEVVEENATEENAPETTAAEENKEPVKIVAPEIDKSLPLPEANAKAGAEYLKLVKQHDKSVKFTDNGLGYKVLKEGKGANPGPRSVVQVKYTGKHIDGSVFDSSNGQIIDFPLNGVIAGFSEGIQKMNKGAVYELYIPGNMGYGPRGAGNVIGPNETLIFEVELVDFN